MTRSAKSSAWVFIAAVFAALSAALWIGLQAWKVALASPCAAPTTLRYEVLRAVNRSRPGFTEGLIVDQGMLYESVGGYGNSALQSIEPDTGRVTRIAALDDSEFGEGLGFSNGVFYQLTWKEHRVKRWDRDGNDLGDLAYAREGWGLTRDEKGQWIASDGSGFLRFLSLPPRSGNWSIEFSLPVMNGSRREANLNELEFAEESVYANIFHENRVIKIDPKTGCVSAQADLSKLAEDSSEDLTANPDSVLNGIAFRKESGTFFLTGKNWPRIYEIRWTDAGSIRSP